MYKLWIWYNLSSVILKPHSAINEVPAQYNGNGPLAPAMVVASFWPFVQVSGHYAF